jgi:DNA-binding transcriptional LysR family regulator
MLFYVDTIEEGIMNDRQLRYAHAVWREQSFSKAGEKLGVSQPSLSEQIRLLEKELGFELFIRSSRGVDVSANGRAFLEEVDNFVTEFNDLRLLARELHGRPGTRVRIGLGHGLTELLVPVVATTLCSANRQVHPEVSTGTTRRILRLLHQQRLDVAFIFQAYAAGARQTLVLETLAHDTITALVAPNHALAAATPDITLLARHRALISEPRMGYGAATLAHFAEYGAVPDVAAYCDDADALKYFVSAGRDIAYLPRIAVAQELANGQLTAIPLQPSLAVGVQIVRRGDALPERLERAVGQLKLAATTALLGAGLRAI